MISFKKELHNLLTALVASPSLHAKWLNTLSFLENCGARKIAACEHPTLVKEEMLKHAAEEFRHAHHLKKQISKIIAHPIETYSLQHLLGHTATLHYLSALDLQASRYLKQNGLNGGALKEAAYLFVTYAIELRAEELYPLYDEVLRATHSKVVVKSILLEEKEHLNEMKAGIETFLLGWRHAAHICSLESSLCQGWIAQLMKNC
jgi:hypothetical protein